MRVLVTGGTGFIGRNLVPVLRGRGHEVIAPERRDTGDLARITDWGKLVAGVDAVIHLAAAAHGRDADEPRLRALNVDAAAALGRAAAAAGARMLFVSTVKVLGEETPDRPFDESSRAAPRNTYARAKAAAESALREIPALGLAIFRPPLVYGPGVKANFAALLGALARGMPLPLAAIRNRRSLLFVGNLADALARALEARHDACAATLLSDGAPVSTPQLCRALGDALGRPARLFSLPGALLEIAPRARSLTRSLEVDDRALRRELAWTPPYSLEEGLRLTAAWYRGA